MGENFAFNAPQFFDFSEQLAIEDSEHAESYFEINHEINVEVKRELRKSMSMEGLQLIKTKSSEETVHLEEITAATTTLEPEHQLRKSLSMSTILPGASEHKSTNRNKPTSKDCFAKLAEPNKLNRKHFLTMSEAVNKFNSRTPDRFHSKPKNFPFISKPLVAIPLTVPHSPAFATKTRLRNHHVLSTEELELQEMKEIKKCIRKANPINPRVMQGPIKPVAFSKKPNTVIEPFNLTVCHHQSKKAVSAESVVAEKPFKGIPTQIVPFSFDSRDQENLKKKQERKNESVPVAENYKFTATHYQPKKAHSAESVAHKSLKPTPTQAVPFNFDSRDQAILKKKGEQKNKPESAGSNTKPFTPTLTQPVPFSFETRDKQMVKKRQELIEKVLEEEKKAREFHAKSPPEYVKNRSRKSSESRVKSNSSEDLCNAAMFKARPATVLHQKPFEPKKGEHPLVEVSQFQLSTERRAMEREEFNQKVQEKKDYFDALLKEREKLKLVREQEEQARIRKEAEFKAHPVRQFKQVNILPSKKVTIPVSPKCRSVKTKQKENSVQ